MSQTLTVRLPEDLWKSLAKAAESTGRTRNALVVQLLSEGLSAIDHATLQALADEEAVRMNAADRRHPDYQRYLAGDVDPWADAR